MESAEGWAIEWDQIGDFKMPLGWVNEEDISIVIKEIGVFSSESEFESDEDGE